MRAARYALPPQPVYIPPERDLDQHHYEVAGKALSQLPRASEKQYQRAQMFVRSHLVRRDNSVVSLTDVPGVSASIAAQLNGFSISTAPQLVGVMMAQGSSARMKAWLDKHIVGANELNKKTILQTVRAFCTVHRLCPDDA